MLPFQVISQIVDECTLDISKRVAKIDVAIKQDDIIYEAEKPFTLYVTTSGDYNMIVSLCMDKSILETITKNMKHCSSVSDEDISICVIEYFNILCGRIISSVNKQLSLKSYFSIPQLIEGICFKPDKSCAIYERFYDFNCGIAKFETLILENAI